LWINAQQTCEGIVEMNFMQDVSEIPETWLCFHKINIGCNGTENNHTFSWAYEPLTIKKLLNWKSFIILVKVVIPDYGKFSWI